MKVSPDTSAVQTNDETLRFQATPRQLIALADRQAREALRSWVCRNVAFAYEANKALACYETKNLADYEDDLGEGTFMVFDSEQEEGKVLCGKEWCLCSLAREDNETCWHSLAARLLLCFRSNHARLWKKQEQQRLLAEAQPTQATQSQEPEAPRFQAPEETSSPVRIGTPEVSQDTPEPSPKPTGPRNPTDPSLDGDGADAGIATSWPGLSTYDNGPASEDRPGCTPNDSTLIQLDYDLSQHPPDKPIPGCVRWRWTGKMPKKLTMREDQQRLGEHLQTATGALMLKKLLN